MGTNSTQAANDAPPPDDADGPSVVICEDHPILRTAVRTALERSGLDVRDAVGTLADARSAWQVFEPDVFLLDLQLPDGSGTELVTEIAASETTTRVLMLSGVVEPHEIERAVTAGAQGFLSKFATQDAIIDAVRRVAAGEDVFDGPSAAAVVRAVRSGPAPGSIALNEREQTILNGMADGMSNLTIAKRCGVSDQTIKTQAGHLYRKLEVSDRAGAVAVAFRLGLIE